MYHLQFSCKLAPTYSRFCFPHLFHKLFLNFVFFAAFDVCELVQLIFVNELQKSVFDFCVLFAQRPAIYNLFFNCFHFKSAANPFQDKFYLCFPWSRFRKLKDCFTYLIENNILGISECSTNVLCALQILSQLIRCCPQWMFVIGAFCLL